MRVRARTCQKECTSDVHGDADHISTLARAATMVDGNQACMLVICPNDDQVQSPLRTLTLHMFLCSPDAGMG